MATIVRVVRLSMAREGHHRTVMDVVVPEGVEAASACLFGTDERRPLRLVLRDDPGAAAWCRLADRSADVGQDVRMLRVVNGLCCVEPKSIEMKLVDPVARIR